MKNMLDRRSVFPKVHVHSFRREYVKVLFHFLSGNTKSFTHVRSVICFEDLLSSAHITSLSTPCHWLIWSRKRSSFIRANRGLRKGLDILDDGSQITTHLDFVVRTLCGHECLDIVFICIKSNSWFKNCLCSSYHENLASSFFFSGILSLRCTGTNQI